MAEEVFTKIQREYKEYQERLKRDIRPNIVRANGYNPERDFGAEPFVPKPYPAWVHFKDGRSSVIVQSKEEHDALLGRKSEPVNIAHLAQAEPVRVKRKYTKRVAPQELPKNLD
jgi:hypothetical protein